MTAPTDRPEAPAARQQVSDKQLARDVQTCGSGGPVSFVDKYVLDLRDARARIAELERENEQFIEQIGLSKQSALHAEMQLVMAMHNEVLARADRLEAENATLRNGKDRRVAGLREAVTLLHARATEMNDQHAKAVLNSAALYIGERIQIAELAKLKGERHD